MRGLCAVPAEPPGWERFPFMVRTGDVAAGGYLQDRQRGGGRRCAFLAAWYEASREPAVLQAAERPSDTCVRR